MSTATVVVCPPLPGGAPVYDAAEVVDVLLDDRRLDGIAATSPHVPEPHVDDDARTQRAHWLAQIAIALTTAGVKAPMLLVLGGAAGAMSPALGLSQKASRRSVSGYVLVDATTPAVEQAASSDWPDAPVHYVASPAADPLEVNQARLRGWTVIEVPDLSPVSIGTAVASALG